MASGRGAAWLAHWSGGPGVAGSNPAVPTSFTLHTLMQPSVTAPSEASRRVLTIPNLLSALRLLSVPVFLAFWVRGERNTAVVIYAVAAWSDFFDGAIARRTGTVTELGKILDPLADRVFIVALAIALVAADALSWALAAAVVLRDLLILIAFPLLERRGVPRLEVNWVGKTATAALLMGLTLLAVAETSFSWAQGADVPGAILTVLGAVLYWVAGVMYAREALRRLHDLEEGHV
jgi:cardiolipin synthase